MNISPQNEIPFELQEDPTAIFVLQPKVTATLLSQKPQKLGFYFSLLFLIFCTVVSVYGWQSKSIFNSYVVSKSAIWNNHEWYRLLSSLFLHSDPGHLLSNLYMLLPFTFFNIGFLTKKFLSAMLMFITFLLAGTLVNILTVYSYSAHVNLLGISGVVYLTAGFWFANYILIDRRRSLKSRILRSLGVGLVVLFPTSFEFNVSYLAHLHGFWLGLLLGATYFFINKNKIRSHEKIEFKRTEY